MTRTITLSLALLGCLAWSQSISAAQGRPAVLRFGDDSLQVGLSTADGTLLDFQQTAPRHNHVAPRTAPFALWQLMTLDDGLKAETLAADQLPPPAITPLVDPPGAKLVWTVERRPGLRVEAVVRLDPLSRGTSRWQLHIDKSAAIRVSAIRFPRVPGMTPSANQQLAVPHYMGELATEAQRLLRDAQGKPSRRAWAYPGALSLQCLAWYVVDGPGLYVASNDVAVYPKTFVLVGDTEGRAQFEMLHEPERAAAGLARYSLPYEVELGVFRGDWSTAAVRYRQSAVAQAWAKQGRLARALTPDWVRQTSLWVWNRGRSPGVLPPAAALAKHLGTPVSVFWHWWHNCSYDTGFPEYLPPREGAAEFRTAVDAAHRDGLRTLLYMNQRLWGMTTESWQREGAAPFAVKSLDGAIKPENYNRFVNGPCAAMCIATPFWRNKYAGLAEAAFGDLRADGVYMDQACVTARCYDPTHGHAVGPGRYWTEGFAQLAGDIRRRVGASTVLAGEYCGEAWLPHLDLMLNLAVSAERFTAPASPWQPIPFFQAVYHPQTVCFGNYGSLAYPPYDDRWPPEKAPPERLTLLDRRFLSQFRLEQARTFVWGQQPMLANFLPSQLTERGEAIDYLSRLVHTRQRALKYLIDGQWLRPPTLDVPSQTTDFAKLGVYTPLTVSSRSTPVALAGAWRAADGNVAIAMASIHDSALKLSLPVDRPGYGLPGRLALFRIDDRGRHALGELPAEALQYSVDLPAYGLLLLELVRPEKSS